MTNAPIDIDVLIGQRIRSARIAQRLSVAELANAAGFSRYRVFRYEIGKDQITAAAVAVLSKALGLPLSYFFIGWDSTPSPLEVCIIVRPDNSPISSPSPATT